MQHDAHSIFHDDKSKYFDIECTIAHHDSQHIIINPKRICAMLSGLYSNKIEGN